MDLLSGTPSFVELQGGMNVFGLSATAAMRYDRNNLQFGVCAILEDVSIVGALQGVGYFRLSAELQSLSINARHILNFLVGSQCSRIRC